MQPLLAIHGGAGTLGARVNEQNKGEFIEGLVRSMRAGLALLSGGASALDAVEAAVCVLEDDPLFNAGHGAVFSADGRHYLSASIMDGATLAGGGVTGVMQIRNPIKAARLVSNSPHVLLCGERADEFARNAGHCMVENDYFSTARRCDSWQEVQKKRAKADNKGTVGAVALDALGNIAAATSTGGVVNQLAGRVSDSAIIGVGNFADNRSLAVSCTGSGDEIIRASVSHELHSLLTHAGLSLEAAVQRVVREIMKPETLGVIALTARGELALDFNTQGMFRAWFDRSSGIIRTAIWMNEEASV